MGNLKEQLLVQSLLSKLAETQSGADRLRPPYQTPVLGLNPVTAGASRDLEVGYGKLPAPYQQGLQEAPVRQTRVGTFPEGYNLLGLTREADPEKGQSALLVGDNAETMGHELVHEMQQRRGEGTGLLQEAIARLVMGDTSLGGPADTPEMRAAAGKEDARFRSQVGKKEVPLGLLEYIMWALKSYNPQQPRPTKWEPR